MACPSKYDLYVTDSDGVAHGLVLDWGRGGAGLHIARSADLKSNRLSTKGDYGVRDSNDYQRIVQSDWSEGCAQTTYDREADSENAYYLSKNVDVSTVGAFKLGPWAAANADANALPTILAALKDGSDNPYVFRASNASPGVLYSLTNSGTWSSVSGTATPGAGVTSLATDGRYVYATTSAGVVYRGTTSGWASFSADASNSGIHKLAFASGVLYGTKGNATTDAQLGYFTTAATPVWTALSPAVGRNINSAGVTFGLVAVGNYVYWGVTNGMVTKVYKALFVDGTDDVLEEVCSFVTGFVGASMYCYDKTVYVGGHYDAATATKGVGAIYAIESDSPALLTNVGTDKTKDNRVLAISAYEKSLYFVSNSDVWRWDLVHGGYSHFCGPISSETVAYAGISWTETWGMSTVPGGTTVTNTSTTAAYDGQLTTVQNEAADSYLVSKGASFVDATGSTVEVDIPANAISVYSSGLDSGVFAFGIKGSTKDARVRIWRSATHGFYRGELKSGTTSVLGQFFITDTTVTHTLRLTLVNTTATLYLDDEKVKSATASVAKTGTTGPWFQMNGADSGNATTTIISELRYWTGGAYDPDSVADYASGVGLACARDAIWAAGSGYGVVKSYTQYYAPEGYITLSASSGNMPTVDKYFTAIHVQLGEALYDATADGGGECTVEVSGTLDGAAFTATLDSDFDAATDRLMKFSLGMIGRTISPTIRLGIDYITADDLMQTPVISEVAVLFSPTAKTPKEYTYFVRCWDGVESRVPGQEWDEDAGTVADWLEELGGTTVTIERPNRTSFNAIIETIDYLEAPPSQRATGREGLYQITARSVS